MCRRPKATLSSRSAHPTRWPRVGGRSSRASEASSSSAHFSKRPAARARSAEAESSKASGLFQSSSSFAEEGPAFVETLVVMGELPPRPWLNEEVGARRGAGVSLTTDDVSRADVALAVTREETDRRRHDGERDGGGEHVDALRRGPSAGRCRRGGGRKRRRARGPRGGGVLRELGGGDEHGVDGGVDRCLNGGLI